ncbi:hypothetical protein J2T13_001372 [Paenibacillus sp. DS2015]
MDKGFKRLQIGQKNIELRMITPMIKRKEPLVKERFLRLI